MNDTLSTRMRRCTAFVLAASALMLLSSIAVFAEDASPAAAPVVLKARDFDVLPDADADAGPAFQRMLDDVIAQGVPAEIRLERGVYRVGPGTRFNSALVIENAARLTLRGAGAKTEIILTSPRHGGFFITNSEEVWFEDFSMDHDPLPYTQGRVLLVNPAEGWFDLAVQDGYPLLSEPWFADAPKPFGQWGMIFDAKEPRLKAGASDFIFMADWKQLGRRVWRMQPEADQRERLYDMRLGDRFVHMARHGKGGCFCFWRCRGGGVRNVNVYASQSLAVGSIGSERTTVDAMKVRRRPNTDRLLSTNSDGVHCQQNPVGPLIRDCLFENMADDGVNIYYYPNQITAVVTDDILRVSRHGTIEPGDVVEFFDPETGRILARTAVREVGSAPEGDYRIALDPPVPGLKPGESGHCLYNLSRCGAGYEILHNTFRNHRRHAMMLKAPMGRVEENLIEGVGALGIVIGNDPDWPEGVLPWDIEVVGNTIKDVGRSRWYGTDPRGAAIQAAGWARGKRLADGRDVRDIRIRDNIIVNPPGAAIYVGAAQNVLIDAMRVSYRSDMPLTRSSTAIILENAEGVRIDKTQIQVDRYGVTAGVLVHDSVEKGIRGLDIGQLHVSGVSGVRAVADLREGGYSGDGSDITQRWIERVFRVEGLHHVFRARRHK